MRAARTAILILTTFASLNAVQQTGTPADKSNPPAADNNAGAKPALRVFLTHRKTWLASGGFNPNQGAGDSKAPDFTNDFHKRCPKLVITDKQDTADYAVTIDEIGLVDALTTSGKATFQVAVYSRSAGLLYTGGTSFFKNAVKDACNAIGSK
jgi:hypothetical protein